MNGWVGMIEWMDG
ncbi:hypothetical protein L345_18335, partial [Ophiophagus hannah]